MTRGREFDGSHWDSDDIRREREEGWFRQNEAKMIEEARARRRAAEQARLAAGAKVEKALHWNKCPRCGNELATQKIEDVEIDKCPVCEGIFFDRGELETLLLRHDRHR